MGIPALDARFRIQPFSAPVFRHAGPSLRLFLLLNAPRPSTLRFMPALTVSREEIDRMIVILDAVLGDVAA
jgi:acetylornithine/N-succinyldiaminopimelate aminotransferase